MNEIVTTECPLCETQTDRVIMPYLSCQPPGSPFKKIEPLEGLAGCPDCVLGIGLAEAVVWPKSREDIEEKKPRV